MSSSKKSSELYSEMATIDKGRVEDDLILRLLVTETDVLNSIVGEIVDELIKIYPTMSIRLRSMLNTIKNNDIDKSSPRVLQHGLLFFALANEPWAIDILSTRGKIPPERYELFFNSSLFPGCQKLLNGELTSLWAFVEHVRGEYIIT